MICWVFSGMERILIKESHLAVIMGVNFFQRTSDAIRYTMRRQGYDVINYIDDFLGFGTPSVAHQSFQTLVQLMQELGLAISDNKLIRPTTQAVCLGVLVDTVSGTVSIPPDKLTQVIAWFITLYLQVCKASTLFC